ncbi:MAG TPA: guanylate kinase [Gemmatimonadaceae bacterium]|nr:guanylate kinase [Gemmatimonadaceae bacterium]
MSSFPVILSSPSGGGKTTIAHTLLAIRNDLGYSVSCTTRQPRPGEVEGQDYFFLSAEEFREARERDEFAESADVHGRNYGTLKSEVDRVLGSGRHVVMDIDVQGAEQFVASYPESVLIFILPPDGQILLRRLEARGTEDPDSMARRLKSAIQELRAIGLYHYVVVNADLEKAVSAVSEIIDAEASKRERVTGLDQRVDGIVHDLERQLEHIIRSKI